MPFLVTLDNVPFKTKPENGDIGAITARMQQRGPQEFDTASLAEFVRQGGTWCGGCFEASKKGWGAFQSLQVCALDFDNDREYRVSDPKHRRGNPGNTTTRGAFAKG